MCYSTGKYCEFYYILKKFMNSLLIMEIYLAILSNSMLKCNQIVIVVIKV